MVRGFLQWLVDHLIPPRSAYYLVDLVIDGGYGDNMASTVIDLSGVEPEVVREGKGAIDIF